MTRRYYKNLFFIIIYLFTSLLKASETVPVIFIHSGDDEFLSYTLNQAKKFNERVILIGDDTNKHHAISGIEFHSLQHYSKDASYFDTIYKHMSPESYYALLIRFQRWFILEEFMKAHDIQKAFYQESDVMLYSDISKEYRSYFQECDAALCIEYSFPNGSVSYWNHQALHSFCSFLKKFYEDAKKVDILKDQFELGGEHYQDDWPHMANWMHKNKMRFNIGNLSSLLSNTTFDSSIYHDYVIATNAASVLEYKRYRMKKCEIAGIKRSHKANIKDIIWNQGLPYCYSPDLGIFVQLKSLHFQGDSKSLIPHYRSPALIKKELPPPYDTTVDIPFYMLGFFAAENQKNLEYFIKTYKPKVIVDLGSWLGASAAFMAFCMSEESKLYAVDTFDATLEAFDQNFGNLYDQFLSNIKSYNLCHKIIPVKMSTQEASKILDIKADLIYMDAATDEESLYQDIMHWYPKLAVNGIICGSNWKWYQTVQKGIQRAANELHKVIKVDNNFWYLSEKCEEDNEIEHH